MSKKMNSFVDRFLKYGMDIGFCNIDSEVKKYEFLFYIQLYVSQILNRKFTTIFDNNLYFIDNDGPVIAFSITSDYKTIIPVSLTSKKDDLCLDIVKCYCLMIKDLRKMLPYIITDVVDNEEVVLNKIAKVSFYQKEHKKYNLYKIASEGKNE